ncbi:MAG: hypothetical protein QOK29_5119, partial [Rhodospirillaceae bacterium]|nr:hypothetical protein [Rhodospirillaceae bacterium]
MTRQPPAAGVADDLDETAQVLESLRLPLYRLILARAERRARRETLAERL